MNALTFVLFVSAGVICGLAWQMYQGIKIILEDHKKFMEEHRDG